MVIISQQWSIPQAGMTSALAFIGSGMLKPALNRPISSPCNLRLDKLHSSFRGARFLLPQKTRNRLNVINMAVDPWSVSPELTDVLAAQAFAASLFPYLAFLYFIGKDEVQCPKLALFGFRFLLAFVGCTIPAGIYAKVHYGDILANVDWLHGSAEFLLTLTNLFIVLGFREAFESKSGSTVAQFSFAETKIPFISTLLSTVFLFIALVAFPPTIPEPVNALSFPTWVIHVSSILEWLFAMRLVWHYADLSGNERWRGLTIAMILLHTSGLVACTYHFFYNAPSLNILVAMQAVLTFCGNTALAFAAYRIFSSASDLESSTGGSKSQETKLNPNFKLESGTAYLISLLVSSGIGSAFIKWGELYLRTPFDPSLGVALSMVLLPTCANVIKWVSANPSNVSDSS